jgi:hypothetical protein
VFKRRKRKNYWPFNVHTSCMSEKRAPFLIIKRYLHLLFCELSLSRLKNSTVSAWKLECLEFPEVFHLLSHVIFIQIWTISSL